MKWIGLTGGIGCGKSTVSRALREHSIPVVDADEIARDVVRPGMPGIIAIMENFGDQVLSLDGTLDRRKLGQLVFGYPDMLNRLESILHPLIREEVAKRKYELEKKGMRYAVYDIPLLFEIKAQSQFDQIVVVTCTPEQQRERIKERSGLSDVEIEERIASQIPLKFKEKEAAFVVNNNQDEKHLASEIERLVEWLEKV